MGGGAGRGNEAVGSWDGGYEVLMPLGNIECGTSTRSKEPSVRTKIVSGHSYSNEGADCYTCGNLRRKSRDPR